MTFLDRYHNEERWWAKVTYMEIYHLFMTSCDKKWTIQDTADIFEVSKSLVSENLKIAEAIHNDSTIMDCESRNEALRRIK